MANRFSRAAKALFGPSQAIYPRAGLWPVDWSDAWGIRTPSDADFVDAVLNAHRNSTVMGGIEFLIANDNSVPFVVKRKSDGEVLDRHPVLDLLETPMPGQTGTTLRAAIDQSIILDGNAYVRRLRTRGGMDAELQYLSHRAVRIETNGRGQISHYIYRVDGVDLPIPPEEMIHIRRYADWEEIHYGRSPLKALGPEIYLDTEATRMVASILKQRGMPGGFTSPKPLMDTTSGDPFLLSYEDLQANREYMRTQFGGEKRGNWLSFAYPMDVEIIQYDPAVYDLSAVHNLAEERITAAILFPAAVIGFDAGLQNSRVGQTQREFERQAWQAGIIPIQRLVADCLTRMLLPDEDDLCIAYDRSEVTVLQEDEDAKAQRWAVMIQGGFALVSEAREAHGLESAATDAVYLRAVSVTEVPHGQSGMDVAREAAEQMQELEPDDDEFGDDDEGGFGDEGGDDDDGD